MIRFFSKPAWTLMPLKGPPPEDYQALEVPSASPETFSQGLARVEYRTLTLLARIELALTQGGLLAKPPNDLPALLRTADQLLTFARQEAGERASVWRCECGTRYAVPVALMRPVSIRCERCLRTLDLDPRAAGESHLADPQMAEVNAYRKAVSDLFREAMARGWPVLVAKAETSR